MKSNTAKAKKIIADNLYLTLATADLQGKPWAAPVYYAYDADYTFYFVSASDSLHAQHIHVNPRVAFAVFDSTAPAGTGDGVQVDGIAEAASLRELPHILSVYFRRRFTDELERIRHLVPSKYMGVSLFWFFKIKPIAVYTLDPRFTDVDRRIQVHLAADE